MNWELASVEDAHAFDLDEFASVVEWHGNGATVYARGMGLTYCIKLPEFPSSPAAPDQSSQEKP